MSTESGKYPIVLIGVIIVLIFLINPLTVQMLCTSEAEVLLPKLKWPVRLLDGYLLAALLSLFAFRSRPAVKNLILNSLVLLISIFFFMGAVKAFDWAAGKIVRQRDLIFLPQSSARYDTPEFSYVAHINSLGFRDSEVVASQDAHEQKIAMIGDSFTFGWGLNHDETWAFLTEKSLRAEGWSVRILNLGEPGSNPPEYVQLVKRALPLLKPDLLVINVLQGDDLYQMAPDRNAGYINLNPASSLSQRLQRLREYFRIIYPHIHGLLFGGGIFGNLSIEFGITPDWRKQAGEIYQAFDAQLRVRFEGLDPKMKELFWAGQINPKLVMDGVLAPDRFYLHERLDAPGTQRAINALSQNLRQIRDAARPYDCRVIITMVPYTPYVSKSGSDAMRQMGYHLEDDLLTSKNSQTAIEMAARGADLDFFSALDQFRSQADSQFYYQYDGHFNARGARAYAQFMVDILSQVLQGPASLKRN